MEHFAQSQTRLYDKARIRADFDKAATDYDLLANLQARVAKTLYQNAVAIIPRHQAVLDCGAGTGFLGQHAKADSNRWNMVQVDLSERMCRIAARKLPDYPVVNADAEHLPFANACFDAVISSLTFQWLDETERVGHEIMRILKPGGALMFSSFGPRTLFELKESFLHADGVNHRVNHFLTLERLRHALQQCGFEGFFSQEELLVEGYESVQEVMKRTRAIGAGNKFSSRQKGMSGKGRFLRMEDYYTSHFGCDKGVRASWEVYYVMVVKPAHA